MRSNVKAYPSPVGGWNARDSLDDMPEDHAVILDNWFPSTGKVVLRSGYDDYANTLGGNVETLAEFHAGATRKFLAAANGNIWDISSSGAGSSLGSGYTNNRWQWVNFNGSMGLVNGEDAPLTYDGSTISSMTVSGSGLTTSNLVGVNVFKSRTYFWENNSQDFWYSAVNALGGSLTKFPLSRVGQFGGNLTAMATWTRDGGSGVDDYAVFLMSSGEVIVYQGSDPGAANDWALVGVYQIGPPISIRCAINFGGDVIVATKDGYVSLSRVLSSGRTSRSGIISDQIDRAVVEAAQTYGSNYGWQAIFYPRGNILLFNVPISTNTTYQQHVFNTITGAPCRYKGWNARCFGLYNDKLYMGLSGTVVQCDTGPSDGGAKIQGDALPAWNYLGQRGRQKLLTAVQPIMSSDGDLPIAIAVGADFNEPLIPYDESSFSNTGATWDVAEWDVAEWTGGDNIVKNWLPGGAYGLNFSARIRVSVNAQKVNWFSTNYMYKPGGIV